MADRRRALAVTAVLVATAGAPLVFLPWANDAFGLPKLLLVLTATAVGWAAWWSREPLPRKATVAGTPADRRPELAVAVHVGVVALATVASIGRNDSFFGSYERYGGLLPLLLFVALAALVVAVCRERPDLLRLLPWAFAVGAVGTACYVLLQTAGIDVLDWRDASGNPIRFQAGTMGNPDFAGGFLGIAVPFLVVLTARARGRVRVGAALASVIVLVAIVATRSRGGLLAAAVGGLVLAALERRRLPRRARVALPALGAAVAVGTALLLALPSSSRPGFVERSELLRTESVAVRGRQWAGAWQALLDRPVLGSGPDTFEFVYPGHRSVEDGRSLGLQIADKPHNVLLEKATDTGVLGLAAYLGVWAAVLALARRALRGADGDARTTLAVYLAASAGYLAQALVSIDVPPLASTGWLLLGAVVAAARTRTATRPAGRPRATGRPGWVIAVVLVVTLVPTGLLLGADRAAHDDDWEHAVDRNPTAAVYRMAAGFAAERKLAESRRRADYERAVEHYEAALRLQPRSVLAFVALARTNTLAGRVGNPNRFPDADRWWARAVAADPNDWEVHNGYGLMLNSWANASKGDVALRRRAVDELEAAVRIKPDHFPAWLNLGRIQLGLGDRAAARQAVDAALRLRPGDADATTLAERIATGQGSGP